MTVTVALAVGGAAGQTFTGAVDDDFANAGNWTPAAPTSADTVLVGTTGYPDVSATVRTGTNAEIAGMALGNSADGSLTVEAGASLASLSDWFCIGGDTGAWGGPTTVRGTLTVNGTVTDSGWFGLLVGGFGLATLNINAGGTISTAGNKNIGQTYYESFGYDTFINQTGGLLDVAGIVQMHPHDGASVHYKISGGTINTGVEKKWVTVGGTFEVAGQATINASPRFYAPSDGGVVLKFSGTDPLLTVDGGPNFGINALTYIDVSELTLSTADAWVPVLSANYIMNSDYVVLDPNTGSEWSMQVSGGNIELMYSGDPIMGDVDLSTCVDDDDLSLLLANWNIGATWGTGDLNNDLTVDDDDLSLLLANWGTGCGPAPEAVPEPATLALLALGGLGVLLRRKK